MRNDARARFRAVNSSPEVYSIRARAVAGPSERDRVLPADALV